MKAREFLEHEAESGSWTHAYLLVGNDEGERQSLIDFIVEKKECNLADVSIIFPDETSGKKGEIKKEQIKSLLHDISLSPLGKCRIGIIYNSERLNSSSANILLKTLEEPPSYATFVLLAANDSVLPTIKSRCRVLHFKQCLEADGSLNIKEMLNWGFCKISREIEKIVKEDKVDSLLKDLEKYFHMKMLQEKKVCYSYAIHKVEKTRKEINGNANQRLALENLFLSFELME